MARSRRPVLSQKAVLGVTLLHGTLLTTALLLRNTLAPPLSMCERGLSRAWTRAERGDYPGGLAMAQATYGRMVQLHGETSRNASLAGQVIAEILRKSGKPAEALEQYQKMLHLLPLTNTNAPGWLVAERKAEAPVVRSVRRRPTTWGDPWTIDLPSLQEGLRRLRAEAAAASGPKEATSD